MKQKVLWFISILSLCFLMGCPFENPFLEQMLYTVTFDAGDGVPATSTATCTPDATVSLPSSNPTRAGYVFYGWYTAPNGGGTRFTASTRVNSDVRVYVRWIAEADVLTVTFDAANGTSVPAVKCIRGETLWQQGQSLAASSLALNTFGGWYTAQNGGGTQFTASTPVTASITVYAKWTPYPVVTFDYDDGGTTPSRTENCAPGKTVSLPTPDPTRADNYFYGWYEDVNDPTTRFTASTPVNGNITVTARWIADTDVLTVTFDAKGGIPNQVERKGVNGEALVDFPSDPTKISHTFEGWYTAENGGGTPFTASTLVNASITTVYANWVPYPVVTFIYNNGASPTNTNCAPGKTVSLPPNPEKTGYIFDGWYKDVNDPTTRFTASTTVTGDITVYAKWIPKLMTVSGTLKLGVSSIQFPNALKVNVQKGSALTIALSGTNVDWSAARWEIRVNNAPVSIMGSGASRIWVVPKNTNNGEENVAVLVWIGSMVYVGNFSIVITN